MEPIDWNTVESVEIELLDFTHLRISIPHLGKKPGYYFQMKEGSTTLLRPYFSQNATAFWLYLTILETCSNQGSTIVRPRVDHIRAIIRPRLRDLSNAFDHLQKINLIKILNTITITNNHNHNQNHRKQSEKTKKPRSSQADQKNKNDCFASGEAHPPDEFYLKFCEIGEIYPKKKFWIIKKIALAAFKSNVKLEEFDQFKKFIEWYVKKNGVYCENFNSVAENWKHLIKDMPKPIIIERVGNLYGEGS